MKTCSKCKEAKQSCEYNKNKSRGDGLCCYCKECKKEYMYNHRRVHPEIYKKYRESEKYKKAHLRYRQSEKGKVTTKKHTKLYQTNHPENIRAIATVCTAVRTGKLPRPETFFCCNSTGGEGGQECLNQAEEYHHYKGYTKEHRLDVVPVCLKCHNRIHKVNYEAPNITRSYKLYLREAVSC